jgi:hypothetical protein
MAMSVRVRVGVRVSVRVNVGITFPLHIFNPNSKFCDDSVNSDI